MVESGKQKAAHIVLSDERIIFDILFLQFTTKNEDLSISGWVVR